MIDAYVVDQLRLMLWMYGLGMSVCAGFMAFMFTMSWASRSDDFLDNDSYIYFVVGLIGFAAALIVHIIAYERIGTLATMGVLQ